MVCTMGNPVIVVVDFLLKMAEAGATLDYHGDFDWPGLAIAVRVADATGARPWHMDADDYREAVADARGTLMLEGMPGPSPWDPPLARQMAETGLAVGGQLTQKATLAAPLPEGRFEMAFGLRDR